MVLGYMGHVAAMLVFGWLVLVSYRYVAARSRVMGNVLALAIVVRAALGVALFWNSYSDLPIAESLQSGDGFWQPAPDAAGYYLRAADAADAGTLFDGSSAAPFYVDTLALWMNVVGISPAAAMFLNLCLYVALMVSLIWFFRPVNEWRPDLPCIVGVVAYSFSPVVLLHSTQPLKEELFSVLVAIACLGMLGIGRLMYSGTGAGQQRAVATGAVAITVAMVAGAGIRAYYPIITWSTLALVLAIFAIFGRTAPLPRYLAGSAAVLMGTWLGLVTGPGTSYWMLAPGLRSIAEFPSRLVTMAQVSRTGFLTSGGGTNIVVPLRSDAAAGTARSSQLREESHEMALDATAWLTGARRDAPRASVRPASVPPASQPGSSSQAPGTEPAPQGFGPVSHFRAIPVTGVEQLRVLATGLGLIFVPFSVMQSVLGIEIPGGQGLLSIADADTIYLDIVTLVVLAFLWRRRHGIGNRLPFVVFGLTLSAVTAVLLGYVVTNYGTLWRMRPLVAIPLWVLVVALSPRAHEATGVRHQAPAAT
jgi:hypothetical protein